MALVRFNPARELMDIEREFNRMFKSFGNRFGLEKKSDLDDEYENAVWMPLTDTAEDKDNYYLTVDLPGLSKDKVKISYTDGNVIISGEREQEKETKDKKFHRIERSFGKYYRSFSLPSEIKQDKIKADFRDGQLNITIPKADEIKPKEIEIKVN